MMKETKKSLKVYFMVVGVLNVIFGITSVAMAQGMLNKILSALFLVLGIMFIYYGVKLYDYMQSSPKTLVNFVLISLAIQAIIKLLSGQLIYVVGIALVGWYLVHNIKKLSGQTSILKK